MDNEFLTDTKMTSMERIQDLYTQLLINIAELDNLDKSLSELEEEIHNPDRSDELSDQLESLFENEFILYMNNIGIYEDLMLCIEREPVTDANNFELRRIKKAAAGMLRVEIIEL